MCFICLISDLKLLNDGCKDRRGLAALLQQTHASIVVADVSCENNKLCFPGQEYVSNPWAVLPKRRDGDVHVKETQCAPVIMLISKPHYRGTSEHEEEKHLLSLSMMCWHGCLAVFPL